MLTAMGKLMINVFLLDLPEHVYCLAILFYSLSVLRLKACFFSCTLWWSGSDHGKFSGRL